MAIVAVMEDDNEGSEAGWSQRVKAFLLDLYEEGVSGIFF
jgi:hypothetical protein